MLKKLFLTERNIMLAILLNAFVIFLLYFPKYRDNFWLETLDQGLLLFFVVEAIVKLNHLKPRKYFADGWNRFDFTIVALSLPTFLVNIFPIPNTSMIILLRMFRLVRLVRFIRFVPNLTKLLEGLTRAIKASVFVLLALLFMNFLLALFACHLFGEIDAEHFADPLISAYSIFQLFTVEGWYEIPADIIEHLDAPWAIGLTRVFFIFVVLIGGIFGLSLANAVFVDEMTIDNNKELEEKIDELRAEVASLKELLVKR
jgi:voltage-gated sodium channel